MKKRFVFVVMLGLSFAPSALAIGPMNQTEIENSNAMTGVHCNNGVRRAKAIKSVQQQDERKQGQVAGAAK